MIKSSNYEELREKLRQKSDKIFESKIDSFGYSNEELSLLEKESLQNKLDAINELISDNKKIEEIGKISYQRGIDFELNSYEERDLVGIGFNMTKNLIERKKTILNLIKTKSRNEKISSLEDLINNVEDKSLRNKIEQELEELNTQTTQFEEQAKELSKEEREIESSKQQLEISKTKLELLEKKSQIWLTILARESIASIIGAFLLVVIAVCLLVSMFLGITTTEIIESAFLLILGYFFGHAVAKKK
ncbi:hypothetical protein [Tenacibaculum finnmarkense]|uniref:hypothetical protein n=1 Tax=Tenacibaculum finnmarkense TaxID=2781243 RepID=UPI001EFBC083|nr:hypothetical protein [Tenacibaculum finnmarkense]MCG8732278.1 hypothetical protein [Tenacibaculum finnmarkense]MCG8752987.1 hypothetical protein [Tenacibaculum finnmarkense]MCG8761032.1 hypothetical protein [Tenacibaculum finnmarkense]MCG8771283.1 hypothetical protein [Tenacibaculum finnmarkense]MCG8773798.1 hypothetical protein [Tenacibaculum finnmarkense]